MKATDFCNDIGPVFSPARQAAIVQAVAAGQYLPVCWKPVVTRHQDGRTFTLWVGNDALKIGEPDDFVRINCSHTDAQLIADLLDCRLPTEKMVDLIHLQADMSIEPCTSQADAQMASTSRMQQHSAAVSKRMGPPERLNPLVCTVGKDWVLTNRYPDNNTAANYGWHTKTASDPNHPENGPYVCRVGYVWQPLSFRHNLRHVDYSQIFRPIGRFVDVADPNGDVHQEELDDLLVDPQLAQLFSYEGPLKWTRHPGVPKVGG